MSDMACHTDGFIAAFAHTHVLQEGPGTRRAADVIAAANTAAEVALRLVRPGEKDVTHAIQKVAAAYDYKIVEGFGREKSSTGFSGMQPYPVLHEKPGSIICLVAFQILPPENDPLQLRCNSGEEFIKLLITLWTRGHNSSARRRFLSPLISRIQKYEPVEQILFK
ncbi:ERBB-3 BINDING PROTEIN 1 [Spatholobus suberectus]|nr:ERBB-3 BINDING PROTEIN 1 [Spatholobus suberectus]